MARTLTGIVAAKSGDKSISVRISHSKVHPVYRKRYTRTTKVMAHDPNNDATPGDLVVIAETKPMSARKRFVLQNIVTKAGVEFRDEDATADVADVVEKPVDAEEPAQTDKPKEKK